MEICHICLLFYYLIPEQFILCGSGVQILSSDEDNDKIKDIAKVTKKKNDWKWILVHGNMIIDPKLNPNIIIKWTIKSNIEFCMIGIHSTHTLQGHETLNYSWYGASDSRGRFNEGDTIMVELNVAKAKLLYYVNGKLSKVVFDDIDLNKKYHLVLKLHPYNNHQDDPMGTVQLIEFGVKGDKNISFYNNQ